MLRSKLELQGIFFFLSLSHFIDPCILSCLSKMLCFVVKFRLCILTYVIHFFLMRLHLHSFSAGDLRRANGLLSRYGFFLREGGSLSVTTYNILMKVLHCSIVSLGNYELNYVFLHIWF